MTTDYQRQALDFLVETNTTLEVKEATPQRMPTHWGGDKKDIEKHIHYTVTLKNKNHTYSFDFWGSVHDWDKVDKANEAKERGVHSAHYAECERELKKKYNSLQLKQMVEDMHKLVTPTAYDILACLSPVYEDNFEDWCASYGYEEDSRTADKVYNLCIEQDRNLRKLFTHAEIEKLAEIN